jgi:hypothetical protein
VGLANIIFDFASEPPLHREFLQGDANAESLIEEFYQMDRSEFFARSQELRRILGQGSARAVARIIKEN